MNNQLAIMLFVVCGICIGLIGGATLYNMGQIKFMQSEMRQFNEDFCNLGIATCYEDEIITNQ